MQTRKSVRKLLPLPVLTLWLLSGSVSAQNPATSTPAYIRGFAPTGAILRSGRIETVVTVIKFLRQPSDRLTARLILPVGIELLQDADVELGKHGSGDIERVEWNIKATAGTQGYARVIILDADSKQIDSKRIRIEFESPVDLHAEEYVPPPKIRRSDKLVLAHYCPLWKYGAHSMGWDTIEPWPERKPAIGFYDEGTPRVADWQIKYALEHGIDGFIFTWDKIWLDPTVTNSLGDGLNEGFLRARYLDKAKFCIDWADFYYTSTREELLHEIFPFWLENYFKHPSYVRIGNRPVLFIRHPRTLAKWLGGNKAAREVFEQLRDRCRRSGFDGLTIVGCAATAEPKRLAAIADAGYDATFAYIFWVDRWSTAKKDLEGIPTFSHAAVLEAHGTILEQRRKLGVLPDIVTVQMGWDSRPWSGVDTTYYMANTSVENFEQACVTAKRIVDANDGNRIDGKMVILDNWNEFGEGHFIEPTAGFGFGFLDAVKRVFSEDSSPCSHVTPADLSVERPDSVFARCRGILHDPYGHKRKASGTLSAWWRFDKQDEHIAIDSSGVGLHAFRHHVDSVPGVRGRAFQSRPFGYAVVGVNEVLYPKNGFTVEFWYTTNETQENVFFLNTAAEENTGYGVALREGKIAFYLNWTQMVETPESAPIGRWTHVAVTCGNRLMIIYVNGVEKVRRPYGQRVRSAVNGIACIGAYAPGNKSFRGAIDELRIHRRVLRPDEIHQAATSLENDRN